MRSINKVIIIGNLTRDPELRVTKTNEKVITFGLATNREWTSTNEKRKSTEFHEIVAWAKLAEICHKILKKSDLVYVEAYLKTRSWDNKEGLKRFKTELIAQNIICLEKRKKEDNPINGSGEKEQPKNQLPPTEESHEAPPHEDTDAPISDGLTVESELGL